MFGFSLESLKLDCSNPMLWAGLVLMVIAVIGYFWMTSKQEESPKHQSVSFAPVAQVMEMDPTDQQMYQEQPEPQMFNNLEEQPTVATCIVNEAGEQVCA
jgi:flagellar basal body-associated protein FliL